MAAIARLQNLSKTRKVQREEKPAVMASPVLVGSTTSSFSTPCTRAAELTDAVLKEEIEPNMFTRRAVHEVDEQFLRAMAELIPCSVCSSPCELVVKRVVLDTTLHVRCSVCGHEMLKNEGKTVRMEVFMKFQ